MDTYDFSPLGFSHIEVFHLPEAMAERKERIYKSQPIEKKELYKWIEVVEKDKEILNGSG